MTKLAPKQAYLAMCGFFDALCERMPQNGEVIQISWMIFYIEEAQGSRDRAMWFDWLAWVKKLQTGVLVPENTGERSALTADLMKPLDPEQAYLAMFSFIEEYWLRVNRPTELGDLLSLMRYTPGAGTADPSMWDTWLAAIKKVQADLPA